MVDDVLGPTLANSHLHRIQHQFGAQVICHRPADDLAAPGVEHDGEIEKPRHCRHISDVGDPHLVRSGSVEVAQHLRRETQGVHQTGSIPEARGFCLLPPRWVVERTFAWLGRNRRLAKDFEATIGSAEAWLYLASVQLLARRLARSGYH
jgi:hypothetical protein